MEVIKSTIIPIILVALLIGCAQQYPITGGEKDTTPPSIKESSPINFSTNFTDNSITFTFDEYVQLKNMNAEFISSPPLEENPEFTEKGKSITMEFNEKLKPNTTYNFNFGNGIVDFTEGNPLDSNLFVISTGDALDSLSVWGKVKDAYTNLPVGQVYIGLYESKEDSVFTTSRPNFLSKTQSTGLFNIGYLPEKSFQILAFEDLNGNYIFDRYAERVAFTEKRVNTAIPDTFLFRFFTEEPPKQSVKKARATHFGMMGAKFSLPVDSLEISLPGDTTSARVYSVLNPQRDSAMLFVYPPEERDTLLMVLEADSIVDTLLYRLPSYSKYLKSVEKGKADVELQVTPMMQGGYHNYFDTLFINFNHPLKQIDPSKIEFVIDKDTVSSDSIQLLYEKGVTFGKDSIIHNQIALLYTWQPNSNYSLNVYPEAFKDVYGLANDTLTFPIRTKAFEAYGKLEISPLNVPQGPYILELMNGKGSVLETRYFSVAEPITYPFLSPGKYRLRLILDHDRNRRWSTGNFSKRIQPETVYYFQQSIEVRANWELDFDWDFKDVK